MSTFSFKHFQINQSNSLLRVGTDAMIFGAFIQAEDALSGLDIGAGTGVLSLMVAQKNPRIAIDAIEIDEQSSIDLKTNFHNCQFPNQLRNFQADFLNFQFEKKYDLIFSNPPFYEDGYFDEHSKNVSAKHNQHLPFELLLNRVADLLSENGKFWLIIPHQNEDKWVKYAKELGLHLENHISIYGKPAIRIRTILSFSRMPVNSIDTEFIIRDENGFYTSTYKSLTKEYHNKAVLK